MTFSAEVQSAIVCEGIRQEINNKYTLVGVFGHDINIAALPGMLGIALFTELKVNETGDFLSELQFNGPDGTSIFSAQIGVHIDRAGHITMPIGPFPAQIMSEGRHTFRIKFAGSRWVNLKTISIILNKALIPPSDPFPTAPVSKTAA
jgi:hypothetical protein